MHALHTFAIASAVCVRSFSKYCFAIQRKHWDFCSVWAPPPSIYHPLASQKTHGIGSELGHSSQQFWELKVCRPTRWEGAAICCWVLWVFSWTENNLLTCCHPPPALTVWRSAQDQWRWCRGQVFRLGLCRSALSACCWMSSGCRSTEIVRRCSKAGSSSGTTTTLWGLSVRRGLPYINITGGDVEENSCYFTGWEDIKWS